MAVAAEHALVAAGPSCAPAWLWLVSLAFAAALLGVLRRLRFDPWLTGVLVSATVVYLVYAAYTDPLERNYDGLSHQFYASYIAEHGRLPPVKTSTIHMHPPLYYLLGAGAIHVAQWTGLSTTTGALQALSLVCSLGFVIFGVLTLRRFATSPVAQRLGAALFAFWPTCVMLSARVHNDALAACLGAGILYFLCRFQQRRRTRDLGWAIVLTQLAVFTKANAYAWVLLLLGVAALRAIRGSFGPIRLAQAGLATVLSAASIFVATELRAAKTGPTSCHRVLGAICNVTTEHFVGNRWVNYLTFDVNFFLTQPFLLNDPYDPQRDYFLNTFLKSSLLGAMPLGPEFDDRLSAALAVALSYLALGLVLYLLVGLPARVLRGMRGRWILAGTSLFLFGPLVGLRAMVPLSMHADFRYVFPLLVVVVVYYAKLVEHWQARAKPLFVLGAFLGTSIAASSVLLFRPSAARAKAHEEPAFERIERSLAEPSGVRLAGCPLDDPGLLHFGPRQRIEFALAPPVEVSYLDVSLDADDQYEIVIRGRNFARKVLVGPTQGVRGLMRYTREIRPPVEDAYQVTVLALESDGYYALGHLRLAR